VFIGQESVREGELCMEKFQIQFSILALLGYVFTDEQGLNSFLQPNMDMYTYKTYLSVNTIFKNMVVLIKGLTILAQLT
jgi:hypothetical protein